MFYNCYYSSLTLLEHVSNVCAEVNEKLQDKVVMVKIGLLFMGRVHLAIYYSSEYIRAIARGRGHTINCY